MDHPPVQLSPLDEGRFGIRAARANQVTTSTLPAILTFCIENQVEFLIARCAVHELETVHAMESAGFHLMDTIVQVRRSLSKSPIPEDHPNVIIRPMAEGEETAVQEIARQSFQDHQGHYHADPRLDKTKSTEAYVSWAQRSCADRRVADCVLVAEYNSIAAGFLSTKIINSTQGELVLAGILPSYQGLGIGTACILEGLRWCHKQGLIEVMINTQITNLAMQKVITRLGFEPHTATYTFHKWF